MVEVAKAMMAVEERDGGTLVRTIGAVTCFLGGVRGRFAAKARQGSRKAAIASNDERVGRPSR
jgi:hypothetical protein